MPYMATQAQVEAEQGSGYNIFGGESLFNNENSARSRTRYVQDLLNSLAGGGDWNDYDASDIFGSKVKPALFKNSPYAPTDYGDVQAKTIADNQRNLPAASALSRGINAELRADGRLRVNELSPQFFKSLDNLSGAMSFLTAGDLPYADVLGDVSRSQELGNTLGTAGTYTNATLKDLGMGRLQAIQMGAEMMSRVGNLMESIDPIAQRSRPQDWTLAPTQTVPLKQQDTQFGASHDQMERILSQQSEQNANVLNAAPDPAGRGLFGAEYTLKTGTPLGGAGGGGSFDWGSLVSGLYKAYQGYQQGQNNAGGGYGAGAQQSQRYNPDSYGNWGNTDPYNDGSGGEYL